MVAGVATIALGLDTGFLTRISFENTAALEQKLLETLRPSGAEGTSSVAMNGGPATMSGNPATGADPTMMNPGTGTMKGPPLAAGLSQVQDLPVEGTLPPLKGATEWLNSPELTPDGLKGKVVLIDFWTYSCINCLRAIPYVRAWAEKYKDQGLVVIGVHTPEFAFEKDAGNVRRAVAELKIGYPVAIDSNYAIWRSFSNQYWPAHYFIDARGQIRHHHFGEGEYDESERVIQQLLAEAGVARVATGLVSVNASGVEAAADEGNVGSPETYVGYSRTENFVSPGGAVENAPHAYVSGSPRLNEWGLSGDWTVAAENAVLDQAGGGIVYRFHARDLHLVLGAAADGKPVRFRVTIDGVAPGSNHGADVAPDGSGTVTSYRLYQLIRQTGAIEDRTFEIQFLDPGVRAFAFTFG